MNGVWQETRAGLSFGGTTGRAVQARALGMAKLKAGASEVPA